MYFNREDYCRVSTDDEEQLTSYEAQQNYYTDKIMTNREWTMAGIFADEGITGTSARKRPEFLKMIRLCKQKKIDIVLTKSISRFARNTVDCLNYIRALRELGIAVIFEKENINTLEADSEILITMLGAFAQAESMSLADIERRLGELNDQTRELVAESARAEDATACTAQLRAVMNEAAVLKEKRALIEEQRQSNAQAVRRIEDAAAAMAQASTHISEWDEALIRQLVDTVKVNSAEKITVFLRGGVQVEQDMI